MRKPLTIINAILNTNSDEWPSITMAWSLRFFLNIGLIMGSTLLTALVVARFGIESLPLLFVFNSILIIAGTYYFSHLIRRFSTTDLMNVAILLGAVLLAVASLFHTANDILFVALVIIAQAVFVAQLEIFIFALTEELFTPIEGERVFPIIESGELIGGLTGGLLITVLASYFPPYKILYFWIISLFLIALIIRLFPIKSESLPRIYRQKVSRSNTYKEICQAVKHVKKVAFLKNLFYIIAFYWILHNLIQFQFTHYIAEHVRAALQPGQSFESKLAHDIGAIEALLHGSALFIQFFIASRVISGLGTIKSLLIRPILLIISAISLLVAPRFAMALLARNNLEIGNIMHLNAYHNSYYAINHDMRGHVREFLEGYIRPIGVIIGMGSIIILDQFFISSETVVIINFLVLAIAALSFHMISKAQKSYTHLTRHHLTHSESAATKKNAITILRQNGHPQSYKPLFVKDLINVIKDKKEENEVKIEALKVLEKFHDPKSIAAIIHCINSDSRTLRAAAVEAISTFTPSQLTDYQHEDSTSELTKTTKKSVTKYLQTIAQSESERSIRLSIIRVLLQIDYQQTIGFLTDQLKNPDKHIADYIYAAGLTKSDQLKRHLKRYLTSTDPVLQANLLVTLWPSKEYRPKVKKFLHKLLHPCDLNSLKQMIFILSKINIPDAEKYLLPHLKSSNPEIRLWAAYTLALKGDKSSIRPLAKLLCSENTHIHHEARYYIRKLSHKMQHKIQKEAEYLLGQTIRSLITEAKVKFLEDLPVAALLELKHAYSIAEHHSALMDIESLIKQKNK